VDRRATQPLAQQSKAAPGDFDSSDAVRSAAPLMHARQVTFDTPLKLELGGELPSVTVTYETYGNLDEAAGNAVLICHAISGDSHVARHDDADVPGWWDTVVGPGRFIDTDRYFVVCANILGGCRGTTGPNSIDPLTGREYAAEFPTVTIADTVEVQRRLMDHLGVGRLLAVIGGSMGGHQAIAWATRYPERVRGCVAMATSPRLTSQALAFDVVARNAIMHDPRYHGGRYYGEQGPAVGLALARMLGHITYLSRESMTAKFGPSRLRPRQVATAFEKKFSVGAYLGYQGDRFVERFDANSYVTLSMMMDMFDLGDTPAALQAALAPSQCRWLVVSFSSDWLFPPEQGREISDALLALDKSVSYCEVASSSGHDAFLLADSVESYGGLIRGFFANLSETPKLVEPDQKSAPPPSSGTFFQGDRVDLRILVDQIPLDSSVLDLGCGSGQLMSELVARGHSRVVGVEVDEKAVLACVCRGLDVIHADLNRGLTGFRDGQFNVVVLSQALQCIADTKGVLREITRVGGLGIVSFPNFAYRKLREMYYELGRSPKLPGLYGYEWYDTPNRRFASIVDVRELCRAIGIRVLREICLNSESGQEVHDDPNLNADIAMFFISA
jgi:homoserine O-acetyltransferase